MSGIAEILLSQGFVVSGSDLTRSENTEYLEAQGAAIVYGHKAENIQGAEVVVYSSAVDPKENPETIEAERRKTPIIRRAEMLSEVSRLKYTLAIAGTHGKTTTTSMTGLVMMQAQLDPTVIVGGRLKGLGGSNARLGKGEWIVLEADEYELINWAQAYTRKTLSEGGHDDEDDARPGRGNPHLGPGAALRSEVREGRRRRTKGIHGEVD